MLKFNQSNSIINVHVGLYGTDCKKTQYFLSLGKINEQNFNIINNQFLFSDFQLLIDGKELKIRITDAAGKIEYRLNNVMMIKEDIGFILCYSITNRESFNVLPEWLELIRKYSDTKSVIILLGLQCEKEHKRVVSTKEGLNFAMKEQLLFYEVLVKKNINVFQSFKILINEIYRRYFLDIISDETYYSNYNFFKAFPPDKYFIYKDKKYPFNSHLMEQKSSYFSKNKEELEKNDTFIIFNEFDFQNISIESIELLIHYIQNNSINLNNLNIIDIYSLAKKYEMQSLLEIVEDYISKNYLEIFKHFLTNKDELIEANSISYEEIMSIYIIGLIDEFGSQLVQLPLSFLYRAISKCTFNNEIEEKKIERFIMSIIDFHGNDSYILFSYLKVGQNDPQFLRQLLAFSSKTDHLISHSMSVIFDIVTQLKWLRIFGTNQSSYEFDKNR